MGVYVAAMLFAANAALIVATVMRYHVWSLMQGRYLFPSFAGLLTTFAAGVELFDRTKVGGVVLKYLMIVLIGLFGLYLSTEVGYLMLYTFDPGIKELIKSAL